MKNSIITALLALWLPLPARPLRAGVVHVHKTEVVFTALIATDTSPSVTQPPTVPALPLIAHIYHPLPLYLTILPKFARNGYLETDNG